MEELNTPSADLLSLSEGDIGVEQTRQPISLTAMHTAQLGKIGSEVSGQNQQNYQQK